MELGCDTSLKIQFEAPPLRDFWIYICNEYVELSLLAIDVLLLFGKTYLCEKHFQQLNQSTVTVFSLKVAYKLLYQRSTLG
jgi:hypothetical protein